jgi:hypothetical protein
MTAITASVPNLPALTDERSTDPAAQRVWPEVLADLARREAIGHLLHPSLLPDTPGLIVPHVPRTVVQVVGCPVCGAAEEVFARQTAPLPFREWELGPAVSGVATLRVLGCERIAPREMLALTTAVDVFGPVDATGFVTRAAHWAAAGAPEPGSPAFLATAALAVTAEQWVEALPEARQSLGPALVRFRAAVHRVAAAGLSLVVPASGRSRHSARVSEPRFLAAHGREALSDVYRELLRSRVLPELTGRPSQHGQPGNSASSRP